MVISPGREQFLAPPLLSSSGRGQLLDVPRIRAGKGQLRRYLSQLAKLRSQPFGNGQIAGYPNNFYRSNLQGDLAYQLTGREQLSGLPFQTSAVGQKEDPLYQLTGREKSTDPSSGVGQQGVLPYELTGREQLSGLPGAQQHLDIPKVEPSGSDQSGETDSNPSARENRIDLMSIPTGNGQLLGLPSGGGQLLAVNALASSVPGIDK